MILRFIFLFSFVLLTTISEAQPFLFPLNNEINQLIIANRSDTTYNFHSSLKPLREDELRFLPSTLDTLKVERNGALNGLMNKDMISVKKNEFSLQLNPILHAMMMTGTSNDSADQGSWIGAGLQVRMAATQKLALGAEYTFSKMSFADYVESGVNTVGIVPGMGVIDSSSRTNVFYTLYLNYAPTDYFSVELGRGKQFIGHGYRSLLLSDNSMTYPYAKLTFNIWKLKYQVLYSGYEHVTGIVNNETRFKSKYSTSNYLSINFGRNVQAGLFQTVVWQGQNGTHDRGFDVNYLNPIVFMRPVEFSIGSPDNVLMGLDLAYTIFKKYKFYTQIALDEFLLSEIKAGDGWWANKYGIQVGLKACDLFAVKGLTIQLEHNQVRPYTYSHGNVVINYGNYHEELAHTYGANFYEYVGNVNYVRHRWLFSLHMVHAKQGLDQGLGNYGGDIFKSNQTRVSGYGNFIGQGVPSDLSFQQVKVAYLVNPAWRLMFEFGYTSRQRFTSGEGAELSGMFNVGLKTALYNQYLDF